MLRSALFLAAVVAVLAPAQAADSDLTGNWLLTISQGGQEQAILIAKIEDKDGKPTISTVPKTGNFTISGLEIQNGKTFKFQLNPAISVEGTIAPNGKLMCAVVSNQFAFRGKMTKTDKTEIAPNERITPVKPPEELAAAQKLANEARSLRQKAADEKDADKKKEMLEKATRTQKEYLDKLREVLAKHPDAEVTLDAGVDLLRNAGKAQMTADQAKTLMADVLKAAEAYGPRYTESTEKQLVQVLATQKGLAAAVVPAAEKLAKGLKPQDPDAKQASVLTLYKTALENSGLPNTEAALKTTTASLHAIEEKLDANYLKQMPPLKATPFAGRTDKAANQVVVMELFTGAECPPCVAADVAFDALEKAYKPSELVLIQYHMHIPGPDPLTTPDSEARAQYYKIGGTPSTFFNGKAGSGGGGGYPGAEGKYKEYTKLIDPLLEKTTDVKVNGKVGRTGDKLNIAVEVAGAEGDDVKLRLVLIEETVKYGGGNQLRMHHHVVRAMPGGAKGVAINNKTFKHTASVDLSEIRKGLSEYLDEKSASMSFPKPDRPMDMKNLHVIAFVQNDKTKEILQAVQMDVGGSKGGAGGE
jgi:hypothetical protein